MWFIKNYKEVNCLDDLNYLSNGNEIFGFIYIIKNITKNKDYIGKKQLFNTRKIKLSKKQLKKRLDKRTSIYKIVKKESNWLSYTGSNKELNNDIKDGDVIEKYIIDIAYNKTQLTYLETKYQFMLEVLETPNYYNQNIMGKFFNQYNNEIKKNC